MAQTGRTDIGFTVPRECVRNEPQPENAGETFVQNTVLQMANGVIIVAPDGDVSSAYGIAIEDGQDLTTDGDESASVYRFRQGEIFEGTLNGTMTAAMLPGGASNIAKIVQASGIPTLTIDAGGKVRIQSPAPGWAVGDTNARVYAMPMDSLIQAGGGNE